MDSVIHPLNNQAQEYKWICSSLSVLHLPFSMGSCYLRYLPRTVLQNQTIITDSAVIYNKIMLKIDFIPQKPSCTGCEIPNSSQCHCCGSGRQTHSITPSRLSNPKFAGNKKRLQLFNLKCHKMPMQDFVDVYAYFMLNNLNAYALIV